MVVHNQLDHSGIAGDEVLGLLHFFLHLIAQRRAEQLHQQVFFTRVAGVVVHRLDEVVEEGLGLGRRPALQWLLDKHQPRQVHRVRLQQVEQVLVRLKPLARLLVERLEALRRQHSAWGAERKRRAGNVWRLHAALLELLVLLDDVLQLNAVAHQKADFDVHLVQVRFQLLVFLDFFHHPLLQLLHFHLFLKVQVALVQQVQKLAHGNDGRVGDLGQVVVLTPRLDALPGSLQLDGDVGVRAQEVDAVLVLLLLLHAAHGRLQLDDGLLLRFQELHAIREGLARQQPAHTGLQLHNGGLGGLELLPAGLVGIAAHDNLLRLFGRQQRVAHVSRRNPLCLFRLLVVVIGSAVVSGILAPFGARATRHSLLVLQGNAKGILVAQLTLVFHTFHMCVRVFQCRQRTLRFARADRFIQSKHGLGVFCIFFCGHVGCRDLLLNFIARQLPPGSLQRLLQHLVIHEGAGLVYIVQLQSLVVQRQEHRVGIVTGNGVVGLLQRRRKDSFTVQIGVHVRHAVAHVVRGQRLALGSKGMQCAVVAIGRCVGQSRQLQQLRPLLERGQGQARVVSLGRRHNICYSLLHALLLLIGCVSVVHAVLDLALGKGLSLLALHRLEIGQVKLASSSIDVANLCGRRLQTIGEHVLVRNVNRQRDFHQCRSRCSGLGLCGNVCIDHIQRLLDLGLGQVGVVHIPLFALDSCWRGCSLFFAGRDQRIAIGRSIVFLGLLNAGGRMLQGLEEICRACLFFQQLVDLEHRSMHGSVVLAKLLCQNTANLAKLGHLNTRLLQLLVDGTDLLLRELCDAVQILDFRCNTQVEQIAAQSMHAVNDPRHVFLVVQVSHFWVKNLRELDTLHGPQPLGDVVRVTKHQATLLVNLLVHVVDVLGLDQVRRKEHGQLGHNDTVAQGSFDFRGRRQVRSQTSLQPLSSFLQVAQVLVGHVAAAGRVQLGCCAPAIFHAPARAAIFERKLARHGPRSATELRRFPLRTIS
eukprot:m.257055 g.257055  ORF g.257055 m.257055 type:complete len:982 (-) comp22704_c2_seq1:406-3351(-)